jgi:hypothetical protein
MILSIAKRIVIKADNSVIKYLEKGSRKNARK